MMEERNPGEKVTILFHPNLASHGASLNAMEAYFMEANDTLVIKGKGSPGKGENRFRYNTRRAPKKVNGNATPREVIETFNRDWECNPRPEMQTLPALPHPRCPHGNAVWPDERVKAMIEEVETRRAIQELQERVHSGGMLPVARALSSDRAV